MRFVYALPRFPVPVGPGAVPLQCPPAPGTAGLIPEGLTTLSRLSHPNHPSLGKPWALLSHSAGSALLCPVWLCTVWCPQLVQWGFLSCSPCFLQSLSALHPKCSVHSLTAASPAAGLPSGDRHRSAHGRAYFWGEMCILQLPMFLPSCGT